MSVHAPLWRTARIATRVWRFDVVGSTQNEAKRLIADGEGDGAVVVAAAQSAGRGRLARVWHSMPGNLYLSFVLRPVLPPPVWSALTLVTALALVETVDDCGVKDASLKWPNDVLVRGRKLAGILAEVEDDWLVLGVGVNLNADLPIGLSQATSLKAATGAEIAADVFARQFIERLDSFVLEAERGVRFGSRWTARMETLGRRVRLRVAADVIEGLAEAVGDDGALMVRRADGSLAACYGGEISADTFVPIDNSTAGGRL